MNQETVLFGVKVKLIDRIGTRLRSFELERLVQVDMLPDFVRLEIPNDHGAILEAKVISKKLPCLGFRSINELNLLPMLKASSYHQ